MPMGRMRTVWFRQLKWNVPSPVAAVPDGPTPLRWSRWVQGLAVAGAGVVLGGCGATSTRTVHVHHASPAYRQTAVSRSSPTTIDLSRGILPPSTSASDASPRLRDVLPSAPAVEETFDWVPLAVWAQENLPAEPRSVGTSEQVWELASTSGTLHLIASTRQARYEGVDLWLGYAPAPGHAGLMVHRLDLDKNVRPLMAQVPLRQNGRGRVVLDPGHGGANLGTISVLDGRPEKDFTLDWARRLALLLRDQGWQVTLTRTDDIELSLEDRVRVADAAQGDLFVSLHFNSVAPNLTRSGVETYCLTPAGLPSTLVRESPDDPRLTYPNNRFDEANLQWAARIHRTLVRATGAEDRGIRRARFMTVLQGQQRPAVLVEGGFLSHPQEARRVADPAYRQLLAEAVAAALNPVAPPPGGAGGSKYVSP